jgi:hypothetical protein
MDALHIWHLILLSLWAGIVMAELVVELVGWQGHEAGAAAMHYWIDLLLELPVLGAILTTGALLAWRAWPLSRLHWLKIGAGLVAIGANLYCVILVVRRRRQTDTAAIRAYRRPIQLSLAGVPFALMAAYLGLRYFTP